MASRIIISFLILFFSADVFGQTRILTGKIIDDEFNPLYQAKIFDADTILLATSDINGNFSMNIYPDTKTLIIASVAKEWKSIDLLNECNNLEIILQSRGTYDFMSARKVDRLRKKQFDKLTALHQTAFDKGIFKTNKTCYVDKFVTIRKRLSEIHKNRTQAKE